MRPGLTRRALRVRDVSAQGTSHLRLTLTDGTEVVRDVSGLLEGPVFEQVRADPAEFREMHAEAGTVAWPKGVDLDPEVLIWGGPPPKDSSARPPAFLKPEVPSRTGG